MPGQDPSLGPLLDYLMDCLEPVTGETAESCRCALRAAAGAVPRSRPASVAACAFLPDALADADAPLKAAMSAAAPLLAWRVPGFGRLPPRLSGRMAVVELIGPTGMLACETASLGLILFGPGVDYPGHSHAAAELYRILSGSMAWEIDGVSHGWMTKGQSVIHRPWQVHAMGTRDRPALALWGWSGDIRGGTYTIGG